MRLLAGHPGKLRGADRSGHALPKEQFKYVTAFDAKAKFHHYFDAYFSLCGDASGEDAHVEAGIFKYSGEDLINWQAARGGIAAANFHRDIHAENAFPNNRLAIETSFAPNDRTKVALKINHQTTTAGDMIYNFPPSQDTYNKGGLYPKASIGMCSYNHYIQFEKITFSNIQVCHSKTLAEVDWRPLSVFMLVASLQITTFFIFKHYRSALGQIY